MEPITDDRDAALANYTRYGPPRPDWQPTVLVHTVRASADGWAGPLSSIDALDWALHQAASGGAALPLAVEQLGYGAYVAGVEPANCFGQGRADDRIRGTLQFLEPGGQRTHALEIGVLDGTQAIDNFALEIT